MLNSNVFACISHEFIDLTIIFICFYILKGLNHRLLK